MKASNYFWGAAFIFAGLLYFADNFTSIPVGCSFADYLWPLIIVFLGVTLLRLPQYVKSIVAAVAGMVLALFIFSITNRIDSDDFVHLGDKLNNGETVTTISTIELDTAINNARFFLNGSGGTIEINESSEYLIKGTSNFMESDYNNSLSNDSESEDSSFTNIEWTISRDNLTINKAKSVFELNSSIYWDLDFDVQAGNLDLELQKFKVKSLSLDSELAKAKIKIGQLVDTVNIDIKGELTTLELLLPNNFECKIVSTEQLSKYKLDGFLNKNNGIFETANFGKSKQVVFINIETELSNVHIYRI